jgi:hypothetical protein
MPETYTFNQKMAIACWFASAMWGLTAHAIGRMLGLTHPVYTLLVVIIWVLFPLYIRLIRHSFIIGIFILVISMSYLSARENEELQNLIKRLKLI